MLRSTVPEPNPWAGHHYEENPATCDMCGDDTWDGEEYLGGVLCPECYALEQLELKEVADP